MNEELSGAQDGRRAGERRHVSARRRRARAIRRRVAGMSLATFLAAGGAVVVEMVTGNEAALGRSTSATRHALRHPSSPVSPSAVTTSAS